MNFAPRERLGIFLIIVSFWYLINVKIFNTLHPIFAIPGSLIFIAGLWLLLSLPTPITGTSTYIPAAPPLEAPKRPATEHPPKPPAKSTQKPAKKSGTRTVKKTKKTPKEAKPSKK